MSNQNFQFDVLTIGGATQDITYFDREALVIRNPDRQDIERQKLLAFEYGAKIIMDKIYYTFGGGAANAAITFSRFGLKTVCLARIGQDRVGVAIKNKLAQEKVNTRFLQIDQESFSGFSFLLASAQAKGHTAFLYRGANTKLEIEQKVIKKLRPRFFYVTSWSQKSWQRDLNRLLLAKGKAKIAWNPGNLQLKVKKIGLARYLKKIDVFDVNKDEAIELVLSDTSQKNKGKAFLNNPKNLLRLIQGWGPRIVVITDGHKGAYCGSAGKIYYSPASPKKKLDTTGAGDAFGSAFVAGLLLFNNDIKKSLHLGILNSGLVVSQVGAQGGIITRGEARRIIKRYG